MGSEMCIRDSPKSVPGGSPQGSILGNFLFCATTDKFTELNGTAPASLTLSSSTMSSEDEEMIIDSIQNDYYASTPSARGQFAAFAPPRTLADLSGDYESDEEEFDFFRVRKRFHFDSSSSYDASIYEQIQGCLLYTSPSPRDLSTSRMPSSA